MHIKLADDLRLWEKFVNKTQENTFLQSLEWQEFNRQGGFETWNYVMTDEAEQLISICLIIKITAKRGTFLLIPHGPLVQLSDQQTISAIMEKWRDFWKGFGKEQGCSFVRVQPILDETPENEQVFKDLDFRRAPIHMHAELTSVLDINPQTRSEKEILMGMRKTTRQMIKKGLKMVESGEVTVEYPAEITPEMHEVNRETAKRGQFVSYSEDYLNREWETFNQSGKAMLIGIRHEERLLSWGLFLFVGGRAFYHQGANILDRKVPASYLSHWRGMLAAREKSCVSYDFWGVAPENNKDHPWANISIFKRGFGGVDVHHLHAQDLVLSWQYWPNWVLETYRAYKRGFR
jgi:lipid II:glycine glycyltransferase (peptidoglycan interpeptide bridge formation enzyme)